MVIDLAGTHLGIGSAGSSHRGKTWLRFGATAIVASFVTFYALYVFHHSDFSNDDLRNLLLMRQSDFGSFLLTPIDVHFVPMHRLLTALVYELLPMNFGLTVVISTSLHLATMFYLYRLLRLLGAGEVSWMVICCYAVSIVPLFGMNWWAHAEHRFPYVFCGVYTAFHYVSWLRQGGWWHFPACLLAFVIGLGFYEKTVLFPAQMAAFAFFANPDQFLRDWRRSMLIPFMLGLLSLAYVGTYLSLQPSAGHVNVVIAAGGVWEFIKMLGTGVAGLPVFEPDPSRPIGWSLQTALATLMWLTLMVFTIVRSRRCVWLWLGLLGLLCLDYLPIAVSNRIYQFGFVLPHSYRFGFEELYVVAVFASLALKASFPSGPHVCQRCLACAFVMIYAIGNVFGLYIFALRLPELQFQAAAHGYMRHLRHDMARLHEKAPRFEQSPMPGYMSIFGLVRDAGAVAQLFNPEARTGLPPQAAMYRVEDDGHIRRLGGAEAALGELR